MSVHVISWVLKHSPVDVPGHRLVLICLADKAGEDGAGAWPSAATIGRETRQTDRNVRYALKALEQAGHIAREGTRARGTIEWRVVMAPSQPPAS